MDALPPDVAFIMANTIIQVLFWICAVWIAYTDFLVLFLHFYSGIDPAPTHVDICVRSFRIGAIVLLAVATLIGKFFSSSS